MAFQWDDLQERAWLAQLRARRIETESKRTLAGSALHLDLAARGDLSGIPPFESIPPGTVAFEFRAPGRTTGCADVYRFYGLLGLLLERDDRDGLMPDLDSTTGILIASRVSKRVLRNLALGPEEVEAGVFALTRLRPKIVLFAADRLVPGSRTASIILYHGTDRAVERLLRERPVEEWLGAVGRVYIYRRRVLDPALERRGIAMSKLQIDVAEAVEFIGVKRVIDEVGIKRVVEEIGLERVLEAIGPGLRANEDQLLKILRDYVQERGVRSLDDLVDRARRNEP